MKISFVSSSNELAEYEPVPEKVCHIFKKVNEDVSVFVCSIFTKDAHPEFVVVPRYGDTNMFSSFLSTAKAEDQFKKLTEYLHTLPDNVSLENAQEHLRGTLGLCLELKVVDKTIIHALDFTQTEEFNKEPKNGLENLNKLAEALP
jgi:hypothetical protein